jgi:hypothetical protein
MATITPFIAKGSYVGQVQEVKTKKFVWVKVGEGKVEVLDDHEVKITGQISILGYTGDLNIHFTLTDQNADAAGGIGMLQLNSHVDENAKYAVKGNELILYAVLDGKQQNIGISPCNNGTQTECRLFGHVNQTVHLDPAN